MSKRKLGLRLYALTAAIALVTMAALIFLPRFVASPRYLEPQAALVQNMVDRWSERIHRDPASLDVSVARLKERLRGKLTVFDPQGHVLRTTAEPLGFPSASEIDQLKTELEADRKAKLAEIEVDRKRVGEEFAGIRAKMVEEKRQLEASLQELRAKADADVQRVRVAAPQPDPPGNRCRIPPGRTRIPLPSGSPVGHSPDAWESSAPGNR
jgi:hypothetical protein